MPSTYRTKPLIVRLAICLFSPRRGLRECLVLRGDVVSGVSCGKGEPSSSEFFRTRSRITHTLSQVAPAGVALAIHGA